MKNSSSWVPSVIDENRSTTENYAKQISSRLFGKQSPYMLQRNPVDIRPVSTIVANLCKLQDIAWTKYAFSREALNGKFDDEQRLELTQKAIDCGTEAAEVCIAKYGTNNPVAIAKAMGLKVSYPTQPQNAGRVLFAEFCPPQEVNIFMDAINRANKLLEEPDVQETLGEIQISNILLGHELFHMVEQEQSEEIWTKTFKIHLWSLGPIRNHSRVSVLSEIAAMSFSKRLNALPYSPYVMDAFLVYGYSAEIASRLYEEMMHYAGEE